MEQFVAQFIQAFYTSFDQNKMSIVNFYQPPSTLTFESWTAQGQQAIAERLQSCSFKQTKHVIRNTQCQMIAGTNMVLVSAYGQLSIDGEAPIIFTETFVLAQNNNNWFILNDTMSLVQIQA